MLATQEPTADQPSEVHSRGLTTSHNITTPITTTQRKTAMTMVKIRMSPVVRVSLLRAGRMGRGLSVT
ncbi:hypothetical protein Rwratislav_44006 [Rhodococcus wratislaviensis IFP 2016]|nr:hypothetical protein Rwratislav_44006 [Rhodococcus wratislaviensis IFP 2016]CAG7636247.1 hypothetical protein E143388_07776 [Rhodococcus opacus]